jgi:serine/threonine protein kinase
MSIDEALRVTTQIAQALQYAHDRQVIHRDVKPDNILVQPDGMVKLTDFGLAKDYSVDDQGLTRAASGLGTPNFMAPEQFADARTADARCDVYSLAATLYNLLTGVLPFQAKFALATLTLKETCNYPPVRTLVHGLNERIDWAIRAALDPDPARRPASCLEFFKLLTGRPWRPEPILTTPSPILTPLAPVANRRKTRRFALQLGCSGGVDSSIHAGGKPEMWPLIVRDVSTTGLGVLVARRFEVGTELSVDLSQDPSKPRPVTVRVVRVQRERAGHWIHGCLFERSLTDEQLRALVKLA